MAIRSADDEELEPEDFARAGPHRPNRPAKDAGPDPGGDNREAAGEDRDAAAGERLPPPNKGGLERRHQPSKSPSRIENKSESPLNSPWGEYLRLNKSQFTGDVKEYPYEPELPDIYGIGVGNLLYYEIDIGTTGTDCDPDFPNYIYNDGYSIERGAARIVYSRYYADDTPYTTSDNEPVNPEDRYVFYTYNHYNDFQEYLNYENGWGEMFGNITVGGVISSKP